MYLSEISFDLYFYLLVPYSTCFNLYDRKRYQLLSVTVKIMRKLIARKRLEFAEQDVEIMAN